MNSVKTYAIASLLFFGVAVAPAQANTVVDIATGSEDFSSLVDALVAQDLVTTLQGDGPFTVFAPNNEAFAELPGYVANVLEDEPELLTDILLYHVVAGNLEAEDVVSKNRIKTVQGENLRVFTDGGVFLNQSEVIAPNNTADNGVVHVIDRVLIPNKVYKAVIDDLKEQVRMIRDALHDVRGDRQADRTGH